MLTPGSSPQTTDYQTTYPNIQFTNYTAAGGVAVNDFGYDPSFQPQSNAPALRMRSQWEPWWRYHWANDLFDYLCVRSPADDYLPNYPMQKEWVQGQIYRGGDLVSFFYFDAPSNTKAHQIYVCNAGVV